MNLKIISSLAALLKQFIQSSKF